jgi:hypothetical protein
MRTKQNKEINTQRTRMKNTESNSNTKKHKATAMQNTE